MATQYKVFSDEFIQDCKNKIQTILANNKEPNKSGVTPTLLVIACSNVHDKPTAQAMILSQKSTEKIEIKSETIENISAHAYRKMIASYEIARYLKPDYKYDDYTSYRHYSTIYFKKHSDNLFEFSEIDINLKRSSTADDWEFGDRAFIFWNERIIFRYSYGHLCGFYSDVSTRSGYSKNSLGCLHGININAKSGNLRYRFDELIPIFGEDPFYWKIEQQFKTVAIKQDKLATWIASAKLPELKKVEQHAECTTNYYAQYDRIDDIGVIRLCYNGHTLPVSRYCIVFSQNGKKIQIARYNAMDGTWKTTTEQLRSVIHWNGYQEFFGIESFKKHEAKYFINSNGDFIFSDKMPSNNKYYTEEELRCKKFKDIIYYSILFLKFPLLEKLYKANLKELAAPLISQNFKAEYEYIFGEPINKDYKTFAGTGLTLNTLQVINDNTNAVRSYYNTIHLTNGGVAVAKDIFPKLNSFDTTRTLHALQLCSVVKSYPSDIPGYNRYSKDWWKSKESINFITKIWNLIKDRPTIMDVSSVLTIAKDTCHMCQLYPELGIVFNEIGNYDLLIRCHDALTNFANQRAAEKQEREERVATIELKKSLPKRIEKYEMFGKKFSVIVPKAIKEVVLEGLSLSHCVKNYAYRYALGETDILFLRKTGSTNSSFYTIEVNSDSLVQVHGTQNKWIGNDPDAAKFLYQWLNKHPKIKYDKAILTSTAKHYGNFGSVPITWEELLAADSGEED